MLPKSHGKAKRQFLYHDQISKHLICAICQDVYEDPNRLICGHTFCYVCIQTWCKLSKTCPICKKDVTKRIFEKDFVASLIIDDLPVKCSHKGCEWMGIHSIVKKHQRECKYRKKNAPLLQEQKTSLIEIADEVQNKGPIQID